MMSRWLLTLLLVSASVQIQAQTTVAPEVLKALQSAQSEQQSGRLDSAQQKLANLSLKEETLEQALVWRSQGYIAWAQGNTGKAIGLIEKALVSKKLDANQTKEDQVSLGKLYFIQKDYQKAVNYLGNATETDEILQMKIQSWQRLGRYDQALPLAERYLAKQPVIDDQWLQFMIGANVELKRYKEAESWQRKLLLRHETDVRQWRQLAGIQQMAGSHVRATATLRAAYSRGLKFSENDLDNLVAMAAASDQPWQGARLLENMLQTGLLTKTLSREERLAQLYWQARERKQAAQAYGQLAKRTGKAQHWMTLAQLEMQQNNWQQGLTALDSAERAGADRQRVRQWREWAQSSMAIDSNKQNQVVSR